MNPLFKKPKDVRFVDMAIWIDEHIYDEDCDMDKAFTYMYLLAYMLASKAKYFKNINDYDGFAYFLAYSTYSRYKDTSKRPIKSVLNYMKSIMYFRKLTYDRETFCEVINPEYNTNWDEDKYKNEQIYSLESNNRTNILQSHIEEIFSDIPKIVYSNIPNVYNKIIKKNIYKSVMLSLISSYTLPQENQLKLQEKVNEKVTFDETSFYKKHLTKEIILWHLSPTMESVIQLVINKTNNKIIELIKDLSSDIKVTEYDLDLVFRSAYENWNEEEY